MAQRLLILSLLSLFAFFACTDNTGSTGPDVKSAKFDVTIKIIAPAKYFPSSGVFNTPVGASAPAAIFPGGAYEFTFDAAPGSKLSFATMMVQSNDFFYAPAEAGIALFDQSAAALSGDITDQLMLWDAGTEADQEPGLGADQAPREAGPNTGAADANNTVRPAADTFGNLPSVSSVIKATLTANSATNFTVRISNVSDSTTLSTSDGKSVAVPLSPGVFVVHSADGPLFTNGQMNGENGLEGIAEDGNPAPLGSYLADNTGLTIILSPGAYAVHTGADPFFTSGMADRGKGLENIAEDGDPSMQNTALASATGIATNGVFNTPVGAAGAGPLTPGGSYTFSVNAQEGDYLSLVSMFVQSNDLFYAPDGKGIALFDNGTALSGDITSKIMLWDAGTEVNEKPGFGLNQAPRQAGANSGTTENGTVHLVNDGFSYPATAASILVSIQPQ